MSARRSFLKRVGRWWRIRTGRRDEVIRELLDVCGENSKVDAWIDRQAQGARVEIGRDCSISGTLKLATPSSLIRIADNVFVAGHTLLDCVQSITIGSDVLISYECIIADSDHHNLALSVRLRDNADWKRGYHDWSTTPTAPVTICRGAWLGARVIVLKGVTIGEGSVIGAGSVVTRSVPPWSVAAGNPARVVRTIAEHER
jgi:acetyltransferase-like isoleucine patch superfamily enzyme